MKCVICAFLGEKRFTQLSSTAKIMMKNRGIELTPEELRQIRGTGFRGLIMKADVLDFKVQKRT